MRNNIKLKCVNIPLKNGYTHGSWNIGFIYNAYEGWYDADAGETEMRIYDNNNICCRFRDYSWEKYFKEV